MLQRLDHETRDFHGEIDARWLDLLGSDVERGQYLNQLALTYGFEAPFESALSYTPNLVVPDRRERTRSGLIVQDLLALGYSAHRIADLQQCTVAPFRDPAEALGWKYVIERPTQLHGAVKRNIVLRVPDIAGATSYLSSCDGVAAERWQQLGMILDNVEARHGAGDRIIEAARAAFTCLHRWYTQRPTPVQESA